jgi:hypothetical protein
LPSIDFAVCALSFPFFSPPDFRSDPIDGTGETALCARGSAEVPSNAITANTAVFLIGQAAAD